MAGDSVATRNLPTSPRPPKYSYAEKRVSTKSMRNWANPNSPHFTVRLCGIDQWALLFIRYRPQAVRLVTRRASLSETRKDGRFARYQSRRDGPTVAARSASLGGWPCTEIPALRLARQKVSRQTPSRPNGSPAEIAPYPWSAPPPSGWRACMIARDRRGSMFGHRSRKSLGAEVS